MARTAAAFAVAAVVPVLLLALLTGTFGTTSAAAPLGSGGPRSPAVGDAGTGKQVPRWRSVLERRQVEAARGTIDLRHLVGEPVRPNILVLMVDDMRDDDLRFMPNVQRLLIDQGVRFANSFSPHPLCCPARSSFLTGLYTHNHKVWSQKDPYGFRIFDDDQTLPVWLEEVGYETSFVGKYLNGYGRQPLPSGRPSLRYVPPGWTDWRGSIDNHGVLTEHLAGGTYRYFDTTLNVNGEITPHEGAYQTRLYSDLTQDLIREASRSPRPFFSWISFVAPHSGGPRELDDPEPATWPNGNVQHFPTAARPNHVEGRFDDEVTRIPAAGSEADRIREKPYFIKGRPPLSDAEVASVLEMYRQRVEALSVVDQEVANIVGTLRRTGQLDNTYVVFTSDNGFFLGEHRLRAGKILPYDPALRVPFVVRGPGIPAGQVRRDPVLTIDLAPTLLEMAGAQPRENVDGMSRLGVAESGDRGWRRGILTETGPRVVDDTVRELAESATGLQRVWRLRFSIGVRTGRYLYVDHATGDVELYDMRRDPRQFDNLAHEPGYRGLTRTLARELERLRDCGGPGCREALPPRLRTDDPAPPYGPATARSE